MIHRRMFLGGLLAAAAAPAIVRAESLMRIKAPKPIHFAIDHGAGDRTVICEVARWESVRIIRMAEAQYRNLMAEQIDRQLLAHMLGEARTEAGRLLTAGTFKEPMQFTDGQAAEIAWTFT